MQLLLNMVSHMHHFMQDNVRRDNLHLDATDAHAWRHTSQSLWGRGGGGVGEGWGEGEDGLGLGRVGEGFLEPSDGRTASSTDGVGAKRVGSWGWGTGVESAEGQHKCGREPGVGQGGRVLHIQQEGGSGTCWVVVC